MFLALTVFSFRQLCLKAVVTDFVLPGTRGAEERGDGSFLVKGGWMRGNGQNMRSQNFKTYDLLRDAKMSDCI